MHMLDTLRQDWRFALRQLETARSFSAAAIGTLAGDCRTPARGLPRRGLHSDLARDDHLARQRIDHVVSAERPRGREIRAI
jgi:hypothetical protein